MIHSINQTQTLRNWKDWLRSKFSPLLSKASSPNLCYCWNAHTNLDPLLPIQLHHSGRVLDRIPALQMNSIGRAGVSRQINVLHLWLINSMEFCTYGGVGRVSDSTGRWKGFLFLWLSLCSQHGADCSHLLCNERSSENDNIADCILDTKGDFLFVFWIFFIWWLGCYFWYKLMCIVVARFLDSLKF